MSVFDTSAGLFNTQPVAHWKLGVKTLLGIRCLESISFVLPHPGGIVCVEESGSWSFPRGQWCPRSVSWLSSNGDEKPIPFSDRVSERSGALRGAWSCFVCATDVSTSRKGMLLHLGGDGAGFVERVSAVRRGGFKKKKDKLRALESSTENNSLQLKQWKVCSRWQSGGWRSHFSFLGCKLCCAEGPALIRKREEKRGFFYHLRGKGVSKIQRNAFSSDEHLIIWKFNPITATWIKQQKNWVAELQWQPPGLSAKTDSSRLE